MKDYLIICNIEEDQAFADRLRKDLKAAGLSVFYDASKAVGTDSKYTIGISQAIKSATSFLFICSQASVRSNLVRAEILAAQRAEVPIYLIAIDKFGINVDTKSTPIAERLDFTNNYEEALGNLVNALVGPPPSAKFDITDPSSEGTYIFLSYCAEDTPFMTEVKEYLNRKGYPYWEYQESSRDYHTNLNMELEDVMRGAKLTLAILSPDWKKSEWTMKELAFSKEIGTPVLLLRFKDMGPTLAVSGIPYIDFVDDREKGYASLDKELKIKGFVEKEGGSPRRMSQ